MSSPVSRRTLLSLGLVGGALVAAPTPPALARPRIVPAPTPSATVAPRRVSLPVSVRDAVFVDAAGTRSSYHLYTAGLTAGAVAGLVVYLDGDGMYGHDHPTSSWALGGARGVVAQATARGYATLSVRTPGRSGTPTFWEDGATNATYVAALVARTATSLGTSRIWLVGYSGGAQLITRFLLPAYGARFTSGGAVIMGGGGAPSGRPAMRVPAAFSLLWYTGSLDDGRNTDDGYDALADAARGCAWYGARGATVQRITPAGLDHEDLGGRFGTVLASRLDAASITLPATTPASAGRAGRLGRAGRAGRARRRR